MFYNPKDIALFIRCFESSLHILCNSQFVRNCYRKTQGNLSQTYNNVDGRKEGNCQKFPGKEENSGERWGWEGRALVTRAVITRVSKWHRRYNAALGDFYSGWRENIVIFGGREVCSVAWPAIIAIKRSKTFVAARTLQFRGAQLWSVHGQSARAVCPRLLSLSLSLSLSFSFSFFSPSAEARFSRCLLMPRCGNDLWDRLVAEWQKSGTFETIP